MSLPTPVALLRTLCLACLCTLGLTHAASAQQYPTKPVRIVVPYTPGGGIDVLARLVSAKLTEMWGQSVYVENRPGAGANLGVDLVAKSAPDGYSFVIVSNTVALAASSASKPSYDLFKDLTAAALATRAPFVLGVNPKAGATTVKGLLDVAKNRPGGLNFASAGQGTTTHLAIELLKRRTGMPALHVPYKGSGPAMTDLLDGRVDALFATAAAIMPYARDNRLLALAVTGKTRSPSAPGVPTMVEAGVSNFEVVVWFGFLAPAGTPREIVTLLNAEINRAMLLPDVKDKLNSAGLIIVAEPPEFFASTIKSDFAKYGKLIRDIGFQPQ